MAAKAIVALPGAIDSTLAITSLVGTETITDTVTAGTIAVIVDGGVDIKQSSIIDALLSAIADVLRENQYS